MLLIWETKLQCRHGSETMWMHRNCAHDSGRTPRLPRPVDVKKANKPSMLAKYTWLIYCANNDWQGCSYRGILQILVHTGAQRHMWNITRYWLYKWHIAGRGPSYIFCIEFQELQVTSLLIDTESMYYTIRTETDLCCCWCVKFTDDGPYWTPTIGTAYAAAQGPNRWGGLYHLNFSKQLPIVN